MFAPRLLFSAFAVLLLASPALSVAINVPNYSFESPTTPFVTPSIDVWQSSYGYASNTAGVFVNSGTDSADHITNLDGNQAAFMVAAQGLSLSQTLSDTFQVGQHYTLTTSIQGDQNMPLNSTMEMELFYMSGGSMVPVGIDTVQNSFSGSGPTFCLIRS